MMGCRRPYSVASGAIRADRGRGGVKRTGMLRPNREWGSASNRPPRQPLFHRAWSKPASTHTPHTAFLTATEPQNGTRTARGGAPPSSQGTPWALRQQGRPLSFLTNLVEFLILHLIASTSEVTPLSVVVGCGRILMGNNRRFTNDTKERRDYGR